MLDILYCFEAEKTCEKYSWQTKFNRNIHLIYAHKDTYEKRKTHHKRRNIL